MNRLPPADTIHGETGVVRLEEEDLVRESYAAAVAGDGEMEMEMEGDEEEDCSNKPCCGGDDKEEGSGNDFAFSANYDAEMEIDDDDDEDDEAVFDDEGNLVGPAGGDMEGDEYDEEDEDDEEGGLDSNTLVQIASPKHLTFTEGEDENGETVLSGFYCLNNFISIHMNSSAAEMHSLIPNCLTLPLHFQDALTYLLQNHDKFVPLGSIPGLSPEDVGGLVGVLAEAGLLKLK
jgi:hypothetical protein